MTSIPLCCHGMDPTERHKLAVFAYAAISAIHMLHSAGRQPARSWLVELLAEDARKRASDMPGSPKHSRGLLHLEKHTLHRLLLWLVAHTGLKPSRY